MPLKNKKTFKIAAVLLLSLLLLFSAACMHPPGWVGELTVAVVENGVRHDLYPYRLFWIADKSKDERPDLKELLPEIKSELPASSSTAEYTVLLSNSYESSIKNVFVYYSLSSEELASEQYSSLDDAVDCAKNHLDEEPIIDIEIEYQKEVLLLFKETGSAGYAFKLVSSDESVNENPKMTVCPGSHDRLIVYTIDRNTGVYDEPEVFYHLLYASSEKVEADGMPFIYLLPDEIANFPRISISAYSIGLDMPDLCFASIKNVDVYPDPSSEELNKETFPNLEEALAFAGEHFDDSDEGPVIDIIMKYTGRYIEERGYENGEEGYAFVLVP